MDTKTHFPRIAERRAFELHGKELVASSGRRRVRGFAAGQILVTIMLINFHVRTIAKFRRDEVKA